MTCQPCPTGGDCGDAKLNFTSLASKPGYWQILADQTLVRQHPNLVLLLALHREDPLPQRYQGLE
jgi:hypothetical protein